MSGYATHASNARARMRIELRSLTRPCRNSQAVEPTMQVEKGNTEKGLMAFAPVAAVAGLALVLIPLLPILFAANPDQA